MLMMLANHSTRMAMAASPAPRKTALMRKRSSTVPLPPTITRGNVDPIASTSSRAPIITSRSGPNAMPTAPIRMATPIPRIIACTALSAARSGSFSPMRRATVAAAPIERPIASA